MTTRTRTRSLANPNGYRIVRATGVSTPVSPASNTSACTDVFDDYGNPHILDITHTGFTRVGRVSGIGSLGIYQFVDTPYGSQSAPSHLTLPVLPSDTTFVTKVASDTNPSRPEVSMPVFLGELGSLPSRIFHEGLSQLQTGKHRRKRGNSVVSFNFGIEPLISDLWKLINFQTYFDKRLSEVTASNRKKGFQRKRTVAHDTASSVSGNLTVHSLDGSVVIRRTTTTRRRVWSSIRWQPDPILLNQSDQDFQYSMRLSLNGWNLSSSDVWELLPWSWFIDYFSNVGDYLVASRNSVGFHPTHGCVMQTTSTTTTDELVSKSPQLSVVLGSMYRVTKTRRLASPGIALPTSPLIGAKQLLTLIGVASQYGNT